MTRSRFGGTSSDYLYATTTVNGHAVPYLLAGSITLWTTQTRGTQHTDLLLAGTTPATSISVDPTGQIPLFYGPDGTTSLWADPGTGVRTLMVANDAATPPGNAAQVATARTITASTTVTTNDGTIYADATAAPLTVTLLSPAVWAGRRLTVKKLNATANAVSIAAPGGATIDGNSSPVALTATNRPSLDLASDGSNYWYV